VSILYVHKVVFSSIKCIITHQKKKIFVLIRSELGDVKNGAGFVDLLERFIWKKEESEIWGAIPLCLM
jgi:hypothetical protein